MANYFDYCDSSKINVFPSNYRTEFPSGKFTSEYNFVNILNSITDLKSYVLEWNSELKVVINGYYFEVQGYNKSEVIGSGIKNIWLSIVVEDGGNSLVRFNGEPQNLDQGGKFYGLSFTEIAPTNVPRGTKLYTLQILKNGKECNKARLYADSIRINGSDENLFDELKYKQYELSGGSKSASVPGQGIAEITNNRGINYISIDDDEMNKLNGLKNKGSNTKFVYFNDKGIANTSNQTVGEGYTIDDKASGKVHSSSARINLGEFVNGVTVWGSTKSPTNGEGKNGDIWLKYVKS